VLIGKKSEPCPDFEALYAGLTQKIKKNVILKTDGVAFNDLLEFMKHATLFIYPSLAEGFGIPPLEAAVLNTPVICSNTTSMRDFDFFGADHIDCTTSDNITNAIARKLEQPVEEQMTQCQQIRSEILNRYNWNQSASVFLKTVFGETTINVNSAILSPQLSGK
jgi:glycosyltransferase involved in cell wall biosynthesis